MISSTRDTGSRDIGNAPQSTPPCQVYVDKQDLLNILTSYFSDGLESIEHGIRTTSGFFGFTETEDALRKVIPDCLTDGCEGIYPDGFASWLCDPCQKTFPNYQAAANGTTARTPIVTPLDYLPVGCDEVDIADDIEHVSALPELALTRVDDACIYGDEQQCDGRVFLEKLLGW